MMLPLVVVGCIKAICQSVREATTASGVDNAASPRLADTAERDCFHPQRELITMQKQLEGTRSILMSSADRVALIDGQLITVIVNNTRASSGV